MNWDSKLFGVVPAWFLVAFGCAALLLWFGGAIIRGIRGLPSRHRTFVFGGVMLAVLGVLVVLFRSRFGEIGVKGALTMQMFAIAIPVALTAIGAVCVLRLMRNLTPEGDEVEPNNIFIRLFRGNPTTGGIHISQLSLWVLLVLGTLPFCALAFVPSWLPWYSKLGVWLLGEALWGGFWKSNAKKIPGRPVHRSVYAFLEARTKVEFSEGTAFLFPGLEDLFLVNMTKRDHDLKILDIRTIDNAQMEANMQMPWIPDGNNLMTFIGSGGEEGVNNLCDEYIRERAREFFMHHIKPRASTRKAVHGMVDTTTHEVKYEVFDEPYLMEPWQVAQTIKNKFMLKLILEMIDVSKVRSERHRELANQARALIEEHTKGDEDAQDRVIEKINGVAEEFRDLLRDRGCPDRFHWGICILDMNVATVLPAGKTRDSADLRAEKTGERSAEIFETQTEAMQTFEFLRQLKLANVTMSFDDAYRIIMDYKMTKAGRGFAIPGLAGPITAAITAVLSRMTGGK